jgi:hypothetical protein
MTPHLLTLLERTEVWVVGLALAAFLALFWAMRRAPIGQAAGEDDDEGAPGAGYRDRVVAALVVGLLLIVAGGAIALTRGIPWSLPVFVAGYGLVLALVTVNRRYRHASPLLRRTVELSHTALTASLIAGILIVVNVLAFRYGGRPIDLTRERTFSLSTLTVRQLETLKKPVTFTVFHGRSPRAISQLDRIQQLLDLYKAVQPGKVTVDSIDPFTELARSEELARRVPDVAVMPGGGVLIEYGTGKDAEHVVVRNSEMFQAPATARPDADPDRFESVFVGEDALTSALIRLREGKRPRVAFTTGHGEPSTSELDPRRVGVGQWRSRLAAVGAEVGELNLLREEIPPELSLLIVVAPKSPFKPDELAKLRAFVDRGGPMLVITGNLQPTGLEDFLKSSNVALGPGLVVDPVLNSNRRADLVYVPILGLIHHPIVDPLGNLAVLFPSSAPIRVLGTGSPPPGETTPPNAGVVALPLLRTSKESWVETDLQDSALRFQQGRDVRGPAVVGVAVADRARPGAAEEARPRMVVLSSPHVADNFFLGIEPANLDLLMNAVGWLRGKSELRGITPKAHVALALSANPTLRARLVLVPTVMAMLLIIGLGVTTYAARRE